MLTNEAKTLSAGSRGVEEAEAQAYDACQRYLEVNPGVACAYAITSYGTKCRAWFCATKTTTIYSHYWQLCAGGPCPICRNTWHRCQSDHGRIKNSETYTTIYRLDR